MNFYECQIFLEDTDAGGIVYHARYLHFMERARFLYFYHKGIDNAHLIALQTGNFVVTRTTIDFKRPAKLANIIYVETIIQAINGASIMCEQKIWKKSDEETKHILLVRADVTLALVSPATGMPLRIPHTIKDLLSNQ